MIRTTAIHPCAPRRVFGHVEPARSRMSNSGSVIAPIVVTSHTTTAVASQDSMPSIVSPCVKIDARINAMIVNAKPAPPKSSDAYRWGNFKIDKDRIACVTANSTTATKKPGTDDETPGTIHAATKSPIAHDARSKTARSRICLMGIAVGRRALAGRRTTMTKAEPTATRMNRLRDLDRVVAVALVLMFVRVW